MPYNILDEILKTRALDEELNKAEIEFVHNLRHYKNPSLKPQNASNMLKFLKDLLERPEVLVKLAEKSRKTGARSDDRKK